MERKVRSRFGRAAQRRYTFPRYFRAPRGCCLHLGPRANPGPSVCAHFLGMFLLAPQQESIACSDGLPLCPDYTWSPVNRNLWVQNQIVQSTEQPTGSKLFVRSDFTSKPSNAGVLASLNKWPQSSLYCSTLRPQPATPHRLLHQAVFDIDVDSYFCSLLCVW